MKEILKKVVIFLLHKESAYVLKKYKPQIIAITGTVGKTSTKDAVYSALSHFESVRRSPKSFYSDIGIPLTILDAYNPGRDRAGWLQVLLEGLVLILFPSHYPKWLVLEIGSDRPGDIEEISKWVRPDVVIVTKLSRVPSHVEAFGDPEQIFVEKGHLVKALKPDGTLLLNADDEDVLRYRNLTEAKVVLFGTSPSSDISAANYKIVYGENKLPLGISFDIFASPGLDNNSIPITIYGTLGEQHIYHVLAALAVVKITGENLTIASKSFTYESAPPGRMTLLEGVRGSVIIDDTYNSSPVAVEEALKTLKSVKLSLRSGKRVAILGDMFELGKYTVEAHKSVGELAKKDANLLVAVGVRSKYTAEAALEAGMKKENVFHFDDPREAGKFVSERIKANDIVLVKGSQGMRMERAVAELLAHPELKTKLLVRQDKEWNNQ